MLTLKAIFKDNVFARLGGGVAPKWCVCNICPHYTYKCLRNPPCENVLSFICDNTPHFSPIYFVPENIIFIFRIGKLEKLL